MIRHTYETVVSTSPDLLFRAIADVASWPDWDPEIESVEPPSAVAAGTGFALKPRGGPRVRMTIEDVEANRRFVDVSHLPLARMRTSHEFTPEAGGTRVRLTIEVSGPLAFLWDRIVARKQASGAQAQTAAFARYAQGA
jgi:uncharacterized protein YndB with AHSA1/START domain